MTFEDGQRLFDAVCAVGLEGVVAKRVGHRYRPGERLWIKCKNKNYWQYPLDREGAIRASQRRVRTLERRIVSLVDRFAETADTWAATQPRRHRCAACPHPRRSLL
jgi:hypothetical protein